MQRGGVYSKQWHIPGGGVNEGETLEEGLRREIFEEVGIDIKHYEVSLLDDIGRGESEKTLKDSSEIVLCKMNFNVFLVKLDIDSDKVSIKLNDDLVRYL